MPSTSPTAPAAALSSMILELRTRCPKLCPSVAPLGLADAQRGIGLLGLCRDDKERQSLAAVLSGARSRAGGRCTLTSQPSTEATLRFVTQWELRPEEQAYRLCHCGFANADAALLADTAAMLERFTRTGADVKELTRLARIFCDANGHVLADDHDAGSDARLWLQECLTLAQACQVVASNMSTSWRVQGPDGSPLDEAASSPVELAKRMLGDDKGRADGGGDAGVDGSRSARRGPSKKRKLTTPK